MNRIQTLTQTNCTGTQTTQLGTYLRPSRVEIQFRTQNQTQASSPRIHTPAAGEDAPHPYRIESIPLLPWMLLIPTAYTPSRCWRGCSSSLQNTHHPAAGVDAPHPYIPHPAAGVDAPHPYRIHTIPLLAWMLLILIYSIPLLAWMLLIPTEHTPSRFWS